MEYNVDLNKSKIKGNTALQWAINQLSHSDKETKYLEIIKLLVKNGANSLTLKYTYFNSIERISNKLSYLENKKALQDSYQDLYDLMKKSSFPLIHQDNVPEYIRTLLTGYKWKASDNDKAIEITYSIDAYNFDTNSCLGTKINLIRNGAALLNGTALNNNQSQAIKEALDHFSSVLNLKFIEVSASSATNLFFRQSSLSGYRATVPARNDLCLDANGNIIQASITLDNKFLRNPLLENYRNTYNQLNKVIKHEVGHALGLYHPEDEYMFTETLMLQSKISNEPLNGAYPETIMPNDYDALSFMYSYNLSHNIEDNIYFIDANNFHLFTIFDQGGKDTIDASEYKGSSSINLQVADPYNDDDISQVGLSRFRIARGVEIENVKGSQGNNNITDNNSNNEIDLSHSNGSSIIKISQGDDIIKLSNGMNSIVFTSDSSGCKRLSGFTPKIDKISFDSYIIKREDILNQYQSTIIRIDDLEIIFEDTLVNYEDLIIVLNNPSIDFYSSEL